MKETVRTDILAILHEAVPILEQGRVSELKELSNHTIHNASIFQDEFSVSIAVIIYALSKVMERSAIDKKKIIRLIQQAICHLDTQDVESYKAITKELFKYISTVDTKLKMYIDEVVRQAEVKKGTKLYDHGISLGQAASIIGISQWELMNYVGKTRIFDTAKGRSDIVKKIKFARGLFA